MIGPVICQAHEPDIPIAPPRRNIVARAAIRCVIFLVYLYRATLGHLLGGRCRFQPSCSQYMIDAVQKHGPTRGAYRGVKRILRCHPFTTGGHDPA